MKVFKKVGVLLLSVVMVSGIGMKVQASAINTGLPDPDKLGSVTIHKFDNTGSGEGVGEATDGNIIADTSNFGNPLPGIKFIISPVQNATLEYTVAQAQAELSLLPESELEAIQKQGTTNVAGELKFSNLQQGIYLIEEATDNNVANTVAPFLVSIPMTNPQGRDSWLYDIHVYPKNTENQLSVTKEIVSGDINTDKINADIGQSVEWIINPSIPAGISAIDLAQSKGYYYLEDNLDERLTYVSSSIYSYDPELARTAEVLVEGTDYTLTKPTESSNLIKFDFNQQTGLDKLMEAKAAGYEIRILIGTTVNAKAVTDLSKSISNTVELYYDSAVSPLSQSKPEPIKPLVDPQVNLTGIALNKYYLEGDTKTSLDNAEFTIYKSEADAKADLPIKVDGTTDLKKVTGVTAITGTSIIPGSIYFSQGDLMEALGYDPAKPADIITFETQYPFLYMVETKAPNNFELLEEVVTVQLNTSAEVENIKSANFLLPITGGSGTILFTIIGITFITGAGILFVIARRNRREEVRSR